MKIIAGNFKMNKTLEECKKYACVVKKYKTPKDKQIILCPPIFALSEFEKLKNISLGSQNVSYAECGALTGEVSASQLKSIGVKYCLIGHSERRHILGEDDECITNKSVQLEKQNIIPIICIGEKLEETKRKKSVLSAQLENVVKALKNDFIVAYEPVWAIGTGKVCGIDDIKKTHIYIKDKLLKLTGKNVSVLYGGSVKPENAKEILSQSEVDGVLVGGACLDFNNFKKIIEA